MKRITLDDQTERLILEKYSSGENIHSIKKDLNLSRRVIERCLQDNGLLLLTKSELIRQSIPELNDKVLLKKLHYEQSISISDIAIKFGTNEQVIKTAFKVLSLTIKSSVKSKNDKFAKKHSVISIKKLIKDYNSGKSPKTIAKELNCSSSFVETSLKKFKVKTRTHSESASLTVSTPTQLTNARIARSLRTRFWIALNGNTKMASAVSNLGCSIDDFKIKIEKDFTVHPETGVMMTWDNYGLWEYDHVKPLSSFDLSNEIEQKAACCFLNIRPEWREFNRTKSDSIPLERPERVPFYIVAGPAGSGKSWVCDQLVDINYISFDSIPKEQHYHYMISMSKNGKPIIYDPFRKVNTIYNRYKFLFDMKIVLIDELSNVVHSRLISRGSKLSIEKVQKACKDIQKYKKFASFSGTSQEVLDFLKKDLKVTMMVE